MEIALRQPEDAPFFVEKIRQKHSNQKIAVWFQDEARIGQQGTMTRVWAWMRQHDLSNRVFANEADIDRACRASWNNLTPERLRTITATDWITRED